MELNTIHRDQPIDRIYHLGCCGIQSPDEAGDEGGLGEVVDLKRRANLLDLAFIHHDDTVRNGQSLFLVVGDIDGRDAQLALDGADLCPQCDPDLGIQCRERLVKQKHLGTNGQGTRQGHALLLPARELVGVAVPFFLEVDQGQHFLHALFDRGVGFPADAQAVTNVLGDVHIREQGICLKNHTHIALVGSLIGYINVVDDDLSRCGNFEAGDHSQGGRFTTPRGAEERNELALFHIQVEITNCRNASELFADIYKG